MFRHYTKSNSARCAGLVLCGLALMVLSLAPAPSPASAPAPGEFEDWRLPLPAGRWVISRGPCGSGGAYTHQCGYYEDRCAIDLTSDSGSMEHVPVLAPQAGQVFFMGTRQDSGLALLLQHPDGRVTALMHLSQIVVGPEQRVRQGQVVAYVGNTGSSGRAHLHFHVQPNTVERNCVPLDGLDEINVIKASAVSHNLAWSALTLPDPPATLPAWLPLDEAAPDTGTPLLRAPTRLVLAPLARVDLPLAISNSVLTRYDVYYAGRRLQPTSETPEQSVFVVSLSAPLAAGEYERLVQLRPTNTAATGQTFRLRLSVRAPPDTSAGESIVLISPAFAGPANYAELRAPPRLCWTEPAAAGPAPLRFRAMVVGAQAADSGWISDTCWQTPALAQGTYYWKVFVRDGDGFMNRTNQRPFVFRLR